MEADLLGFGRRGSIPGLVGSSGAYGRRPSGPLGLAEVQSRSSGGKLSQPPIERSVTGVSSKAANRRRLGSMITKNKAELSSSGFGQKAYNFKVGRKKGDRRSSDAGLAMPVPKF